MDAEELLDCSTDEETKMDFATPTSSPAKTSADHISLPPVLISSTSPASTLTSTSLVTATSTIPAPSTSSSKNRLKCIHMVEKTLQVQCLKARGSQKCLLCGYSGKAELLKEHIKQHFTRYFCVCGRSAGTKARIGNHIYGARREGMTGHDQNICYEVDRNNFPLFLQKLSLPSASDFGEVLPHKSLTSPATVPSSTSILTTTVTTTPVTSTVTTAPVASTTTTYKSQDVRMTMSREDIQRDAREILENRRKSKKRVSSSADRSSTYQDELAQVKAERDQLRKENEQLKLENQVTKKAMKTIRDNLAAIQGMQSHLSIAQAAAECHLGL